MIPCEKCGHDNPLGTAFCHSCGARLEVRTDHVLKSVAATEKANRERKLLDAGRGALSFAGFLLICALVLDFGLAPALPDGRIPNAPAIEVFDPATPDWAKAPANAAPPAPPTIGATLSRLDLRRLRAPTVAQALGIDVAAIAGLRQSLIATIHDDGSVGGADPLAGAALAALALQAWPDDASAAAAARVRTWLLAHAKDAIHAPALPRSLATAALVDAGALDAATRGAMGNRVVDGAAPIWQMLTLPLYAADQRPSELVGLRAVREDATWQTMLALVNGEASPRAADACAAATAAAATTGEERALWAYAAWQLGRAPDVVAATLKEWATKAPAPVDAALAKAAGPTAPAAVLLITLGAPLRTPPLLLQR